MAATIQLSRDTHVYIACGINCGILEDSGTGRVFFLAIYGYNGGNLE